MAAASEEPMQSTGTDASVPNNPAEAEWPPREWREAQRGGGTKGVYYVAAAIAGIMILLVILSFWGVSNG
jgi:hypothetical protein